MITVELRSRIRRLFFAEHWKIGTIAAQLGVHHDTVRAAVEAERFVHAHRPIRPSILDPYKEFVRQQLEQYPRLRATRLFQMVVDRGYPGEFVYQPVKIGERKGRVFVEVHQDVYQMFEDLQAHARTVVAQAKLDERVDPDRLFLAVKQQLGIPIDVTRETAKAGAASDANDDQVVASE